MRSFMFLQKTDLGMDPSRTLTFRVGLPEAQFTDLEVARRFFAQLIPKPGRFGRVSCFRVDYFALTIARSTAWLGQQSTLSPADF